MDRKFVLPSLVVGSVDVMRLRRELESLNDYMDQAALRKAGEESIKLPKTSRILDEFVNLNKLNMLQATDREAADRFLRALVDHAPTIHISFAADPSAAFVDKIVVWLRNNIHPQLLLSLGLQPTIAAGCIVRTPNRYYDLSLRRHFAAKRQLLLDKLESVAAQ